MKRLLALTFLLTVIPTTQSVAAMAVATCTNIYEMDTCDNTPGCQIVTNSFGSLCKPCSDGYYGTDCENSCLPTKGTGKFTTTSDSTGYARPSEDRCVWTLECPAGSYWGGLDIGCKKCPANEISQNTTEIERIGTYISQTTPTTCNACGKNAYANYDRTECICNSGYKDPNSQPGTPSNNVSYGVDCVLYETVDYPIYKLNIYKYRPWVKNDTATITGYLGNPKNLNGFSAKIVIPTAGESVPTFDTTEFKQWFWGHTGSNGPTIEIPPEHTYLYRTDGYFCYTDGTVEELPDTFTTATYNYCGDHSGVAMGQPYDVNAADWSGTAEENKTINIFPEWYYQTYTITYMPFNNADKSYVPIDSFPANEYIQIRDIADTRFDKWFTESSVASSISGKIFAKNGDQWKTSAGTIYTPGEDYPAEYLYPNLTLTLYPNVTDCTAGFYCPLPTLENRDLRFKDTKKCPEGFYCPAGSSETTPCDAGYYCPEKSPEQTICPLGYYCQSTTGGVCTTENNQNTTCVPPDDSKCPVGLTTDKIGATAKTECGITSATKFKENNSKEKFFTLPLGDDGFLSYQEQTNSI